MQAGIAVTGEMRRFSATHKTRKEKFAQPVGISPPLFRSYLSHFDPPSFPNPRVRNATNGRQLPWVCRTVYLWHVVVRQRTSKLSSQKTPHWEQSSLLVLDWRSATERKGKVQFRAVVSVVSSDRLVLNPFATCTHLTPTNCAGFFSSSCDSLLMIRREIAGPWVMEELRKNFCLRSLFQSGSRERGRSNGQNSRLEQLLFLFVLASGRDRGRYARSTRFLVDVSRIADFGRRQAEGWRRSAVRPDLLIRHICPACLSVVSGLIPAMVSEWPQL
ncbi:hypothetical protein B0J18DRAFT_77486 [Chaetomium sp. MPI-SDFR-AT-0129]|nr:hypothetical protein B0J18DRAFT_77486 [Chaetomium sp. MPI-SDFR-AT-0129]